ncbi:hypothetical protein TMRO357_02623 [Alteriqipengyuania sp. 357]
MNRNYAFACILGAVITSGCVYTSKKDLSRMIAQECASYGDDVRVRIKDPELKGGIFGSYVGTGECLRPTDEGYEDAMTPDQYLKSLEEPRD